MPTETTQKPATFRKAGIPIRSFLNKLGVDVVNGGKPDSSAAPIQQPAHPQIEQVLQVSVATAEPIKSLDMSQGSNAIHQTDSVAAQTQTPNTGEGTPAEVPTVAVDTGVQQAQTFVSPAKEGDFTGAPEGTAGVKEPGGPVASTVGGGKTQMQEAPAAAAPEATAAAPNPDPNGLAPNFSSPDSAPIPDSSLPGAPAGDLTTTTMGQVTAADSSRMETGQPPVQVVEDQLPSQPPVVEEQAENANRGSTPAASVSDMFTKGLQSQDSSATPSVTEAGAEVLGSAGSVDSGESKQDEEKHPINPIATRLYNENKLKYFKFEDGRLEFDEEAFDRDVEEASLKPENIDNIIQFDSKLKEKLISKGIDLVKEDKAA